jgi:hypothetical protein
LLVVGAVVIIVIIGLGVALNLSSSSSLPQSKTVHVDASSTCKSLTSSFSCTVILDPDQGATVTAADVKSVAINGTVSTPTMKASGSSVTVVASVPISTPGCVSGCPPSAAANSVPHVGEVVIDLTDGTEVSVQLGAGGIIT